jgi:hypothetical protein
MIGRAGRGRRTLQRLSDRLGRGDRSVPPEIRSTFRDPELQAHYERDGFVVVDLLTDDEVAAMNAAYGALDHRVPEAAPFAEGFHTSLYDPRVEYRRSVLDAFEEHVGPGLRRVLDDHRIFFANYTVKMPGGGPVPLHSDWTFLDEDRFSSATVWCPLVDTTERNGALGVVVGSHRRIDFLRIVNVGSFDRSQAAVADIEDRRVVPMRAGQAIVMDNRVVHFSPPNDSEGVRVAAACVVGPAEADLHHYWVDPEQNLVRFTLHPEFFLSYVIGQPPTDADGVIDMDVLVPRES